MPPLQLGTDEWRASVVEEIIDPDRRIVDPHHHLWPAGDVLPYTVADLRADVGSATASRRRCSWNVTRGTDGGPAALAPVGESEFVAAAARESGGLIAAMVGHADLRLPELDDVLDAHVEASAGLFRGIRDALPRAEPDLG